MRKLALCAAALCGALVLASATQVEAAPKLSVNNPYRSFNVTGYNYGSMQWEKQHRKSSSSSSSRTSYRLFRRR